jgi:putative phosphoesterase
MLENTAKPLYYEDDVCFFHVFQKQKGKAEKFDINTATQYNDISEGRAMKILIFSDSHGDVETMRSVAALEKPDKIIHLGDSIEDAEVLRILYKEAEIISVPGNVDGGSAASNHIQYIEICGKRFMLTHGHAFDKEKNGFERSGVRNIGGIDQMMLYGSKNNADIILFGHSHEPYINSRNGEWIMNPGRIGRKSGQIIHATYGVLIIEEEKLQWQISEVRDL